MLASEGGKSPLVPVVGWITVPKHIQVLISGTWNKRDFVDVFKDFEMEDYGPKSPQVSL